MFFFEKAYTGEPLKTEVALQYRKFTFIKETRIRQYQDVKGDSISGTGTDCVTNRTLFLGLCNPQHLGDGVFLPLAQDGT